MFIFMLTNTLFYTLSCTQYFKTKDLLHGNLKPKAQGYNYNQKNSFIHLLFLPENFKSLQKMLNSYVALKTFGFRLKRVQMSPSLIINMIFFSYCLSASKHTLQFILGKFILVF